jgi:predicted short-subunit dehydrogenase-like oxidoreductase (DUF2520 family)
MSGALTTDPLHPLHDQGYAVGMVHPLQSIAHPIRGAEHLPGSYFAVAGETQAVAVARRLMALIRGRALTIPSVQRPLYHASAVMASNHLLALIAVAARALARTGVSSEDALKALVSLARGTLDNLEEFGPERALTGPVMRGDLETIRLHLRVLEPEDRELYAALAKQLVDLATNLDADTTEELISLLS